MCCLCYIPLRNVLDQCCILLLSADVFLTHFSKLLATNYEPSINSTNGRPIFVKASRQSGSQETFIGQKIVGRTKISNSLITVSTVCASVNGQWNNCFACIFLICGLVLLFSFLFCFQGGFFMVVMLCCGVFPDAEWVHSSHLPLVLSRGSRLTGLSTCQ